MKKFLFAVAGLLLSGCSGSANLKSLYLLDSPRLIRNISPLNGMSVYVDRFQAAQPFDTQKFVYKTGAWRYEVDNYREFLVPVSVMTQLQTADWLDGCGAKLAPSRTEAEFIVKGFVTEFYLDASKDQEKSVVLSVRYFVLREDGRAETFTLHADDSLASRDADEFVASSNRALRKILTQFETKLAGLLAPVPAQ